MYNVHLVESRADAERCLTRTWSAEGQELRLAKISRRSVVAFGVSMMGRSLARWPLGGIAVLESFGRVVACCRLSLAVDGDAQCLTLERLVQQLVLSSRSLDVSGVKVTERSFGEVRKPKCQRRHD
jgi:hypothetical protein